MPLIIITGFPASGKSTRTSELKNYFEEKLNKKVHVISENDVLSSSNMDKSAMCFDSSKEKEVRSILMSSAQRSISREDIVILDAANYIKGYRYELYCMSKSSKTTQCTIECHTPAEVAWSFNIQRPTSNSTGDQPYSHESFDALVMRYEAPDSRNRWDSPLFILQPKDQMPAEAIAASLFGRTPPPPNQSTQNAPLSSTNYLHELDRITQEVAEAILSAQNANLEGDIKVPGYSDLTVHLSGKKISAAQLGRSRRQFLTYSKMHPVKDTSELGHLFVHYLNTSLL